MMYKCLGAAFLAMVFVKPGLAQSPSDLPDTTLLDEVVAATDAEDSDQLLALMLEVKTRGLLMFPEPARCQMSYPDTPYFNNEFFRGAVRRGYFTDLSEQAMADGNCGCAWEEADLDAFLTRVIGKTAIEVVDEDFNTLKSYRRQEWSSMAEQYRDFKNQQCGQS